MIEKEKLYGFALAIPEFVHFIPSLWKAIEDWMNTSSVSFDRLNGVKKKMSDAQCGSKSQCCLDRFQYWNNFELAAFSIWRDPKYISYFDYLDKHGGFFYERWGDAPVHTFYLMTMYDVNVTHHFSNIGYRHYAIINFPVNETIKGECKEQKDLDWDAMGILKNCQDVWSFLNN